MDNYKVSNLLLNIDYFLTLNKSNSRHITFHHSCNVMNVTRTQSWLCNVFF
jgi:hypothetical protein